MFVRNGVKERCKSARTVFGDVVEVVTTDDDGTEHFDGHNLAGQDTATDGDITGEGALLVWMAVSQSSLHGFGLVAHRYMCPQWLLWVS